MMTGKRAGVGRKGRFGSKAELLAGGSAVQAFRYQRASQDKKQQAKSVGDQGSVNVADIDRHGWTDADSFTDNDSSASQYARKGRSDFERLKNAIQGGAGDVLVVWEVSRQQRDLAVFTELRNLCIQSGLFYWLVGGRLFDLRDKDDRMMLGFQAVQAEWLADSIHDNVQRGIDLAAADGRPHGKVTYGYRRIYNDRTRALVRQELDTEPRDATAPDATVSTYTAAGVVREIFRKVTGGVPLITIEQDLNGRGIPSPQGSTWRRGVIRKMALNPAYIGKRVLRGEIIGEGNWPELVDEETYWTAVRVLQDPARTTTRPGRAIHLLSYIAECGVCGGPLQMSKVNRRGWTGQVYGCLNRRCVAVKSEYLDEFTERAVVAWLASPGVFDALAANSNDSDVVHARAEAQRLRTDLEEYKQLAEAGQLKPTDYLRFERGLTEQIKAAEAVADQAGIPPILRGRVGPQAVTTWEELEDDIAVKREIIRTVARIRLLPAAHKGERRPFGRHRLDWSWKFGPDTAPADSVHAESA